MMTVRFLIPEYLRQWYLNTREKTLPVKLDKNSVESKFLKVYLSKVPRDYDGTDLLEPFNFEVQIPEFKGMPAQYYCYLSPRFKVLYVNLMKNMFDVALFQSVYESEAMPLQRKDVIAAWMEANGIEITDRNWEAVIKRYNRMLTRYRDRERKKC